MSLTLPETIATSTSGDVHRLVAGSDDPQSWLLAPDTINTHMPPNGNDYTLINDVIIYKAKDTNIASHFAPLQLP